MGAYLDRSKHINQEYYVQEIQLLAHYLNFYGDGKFLHIFDHDVSCATIIPRIRARVSGVNVLQCCVPT